jgi:anthranilate/para-aminobenzoate synthase component II
VDPITTLTCERLSGTVLEPYRTAIPDQFKYFERECGISGSSLSVCRNTIMSDALLSLALQDFFVFLSHMWFGDIIPDKDTDSASFWFTLCKQFLQTVSSNLMLETDKPSVSTLKRKKRFIIVGSSVVNNIDSSQLPNRLNGNFSHKKLLLGVCYFFLEISPTMPNYIELLSNISTMGQHLSVYSGKAMFRYLGSLQKYLLYHEQNVDINLYLLQECIASLEINNESLLLSHFVNICLKIYWNNLDFTDQKMIKVLDYLSENSHSGISCGLAQKIAMVNYTILLFACALHFCDN